MFDDKAKRPDLSDLLFHEQHLGNREKIAQSLSLELLFGQSISAAYDRKSDLLQLSSLGLSQLEQVAATMRVAARNWFKKGFISNYEESKELFTLVKKVWFDNYSRQTLRNWDFFTFISIGRLFAYICFDMEEWEKAAQTMASLKTEVVSYHESCMDSSWLMAPSELSKFEIITTLKINLELSWMLNANNQFEEEESVLRSSIDDLLKAQEYELEDSPLLSRLRYRLAYCYAIQKNLRRALEELVQAESEEDIHERKHDHVVTTSLLRELDLGWLLNTGLTETEVRENAHLLLPRMVIIWTDFQTVLTQPADFPDYTTYLYRS